MGVIWLYLHSHGKACGKRDMARWEAGSLYGNMVLYLLSMDTHASYLETGISPDIVDNVCVLCETEKEKDKEGKGRKRRTCFLAWHVAEKLEKLYYVALL